MQINLQSNYVAFFGAGINSDEFGFESIYDLNPGLGLIKVKKDDLLHFLPQF